jgi:hypothetical protein
MLGTLDGDFRLVNREGVVHFVMLEVVLDQQCDQLAVWVFVNLACNWVLPLEASSLLRVRVSVVLDCFEHLGSELRSQCGKSTFLL